MIEVISCEMMLHELSLIRESFYEKKQLYNSLWKLNSLHYV